MDSFLEYIQSVSPPISDRNVEILQNLELNSRMITALATSEIVEVLTSNGISRLVALDIVTSAKEYFSQQNQLVSHPLGIFWDVENVAIPRDISGQRAGEMLKKAVSSLGNPLVCNAYFESTGPNMGMSKRQHLQQCGWNLMDVPHLSKKEVADKVMIVDILLFVLDHADKNCTVCLVSDDTDFSYLLAKLKVYPLVKTVVITKSSLSENWKLLTMFADVSMRWGADIMKVPVVAGERVEAPRPPATDINVVAPSPPRAAQQQLSSPNSAKYSVGPLKGPNFPTFPNVVVGEDDNTSVDDDDTYSVADSFEYDQNVLEKVLTALGSGPHLKSRVGIKLGEYNPAAYNPKGDPIKGKEIRRAVFERGIASGRVIQQGEGGYVTLELVA